MSAPGQTAIQPVNLNTFPRQAEGSKTLLITQNWSDPSLAANKLATYNLLQQYQTGQFTNIQAVWIDNSTNSLSVRLTAVETGQQIKVGPFTQGMYPLASAVAPVFTLQQQAYPVSNIATTRLMFFNTPQRYFVQENITVFDAGAVNVSGPLNGAGVDTNFITNVNPATIYFRMTAFQLSLIMNTAGPWPGNMSVTIQLKDNTDVVWADTFNVSAASFGTIFDKAFMFPVPTHPTITNDIWSLNLSAFPPGGVSFNITYYFDTVQVQ